jgi:hypothetical protein
MDDAVLQLAPAGRYSSSSFEQYLLQNKWEHLLEWNIDTAKLHVYNVRVCV